MKRIKLLFLFLAFTALAFTLKKHRPVLYIIGDSTVKNGDGKSSNQLQGWGSFMQDYFDSTKIDIQNHAIGGRSSRTFLTDGRWDKILASLQKGDYVIMQFGHNDGAALDDTARARGTIKGIGDDSTDIYNPIRKQKETVYTYGWYLRKYVNDTKAKGALAIVCSPIPRNDWKDGKVLRSNESYALWAKQVAEQTNAFFIDLNNLIADEFEKVGQTKVNGFFPQEHTHTNKEGALFNANMVVEGLKEMPSCKLNKYLSKK